MTDFESSRSNEKLSNGEDARTVLSVCPTCRGKGFVADPVDKRSAVSIKTSETTSMPLAMPKIRCPPFNGRSSSLPKSSGDGMSILPPKLVGPGSNGYQNRSRRVERSQPPSRRDPSVASSDDSLNNGEIIPQVEIVDMQEFIKRAKSRMKSNDLDEVSSGVVDVVHICRADENFALSLMPTVNRRISYVTRPEFDEMLILLLKRTGDTKKRVRDDAVEALEIFVTSSPPVFVIRALVERGTESKSSALRITAAKIIARCVNQVGRAELLSRPALRDMRKRVLKASCALLLDSQAEVRCHAMDIMNQLKDEEGFEEALESDVGQKLLKQVEQKLMWLRHSTKTVISHEIKPSETSESQQRQ